MTAQQAMRYERRRQRELQRQREIKDTLMGILVILFILAAFAFAGTMDYHDEQAQLAYWESQGIHIARDW